MQKRSLIKINYSRIISILLCLVLMTACAAPATTEKFDVNTIEWVHIDDIADTYTYAGDFATEQAQLKAWVASPGNWPKIQQYLDELTEATLQVYSAQGLQDIHTLKNVNDVKEQQDAQEIDELSDKIYDHQKNMTKLVVESQYLNQFSERYGEDIVDYIQGDTTDELDVPGESSIIQQGQIAFVSDYHFVYKGEDWTFNKLWNYTGDLSSEDYWAINDGLCAEKNNALGTLLISLIEERNRAVHNAGIEDYPTYAHQTYTFRDYSLDEVLGLCEAVKNSRLPDLFTKVTKAYNAEYNNTYALNDSVFKNKDMSEVDVFKEISGVTGKRSETIGKIAESLSENKLYFHDNYTDGAYAPMMAPLPAYGLGIIYVPKDVPISDEQILFHEFGHFCTSVITAPKDPVAKMRDIVIGSEIPTELDSYGMQMLLLQDYSDLFGEDAPAVKLYFLQYVLYNIVSSALYSEFEISLYIDPPESVEEANARFSDLEEAYGNNIDRPDIPNGMLWAEVPHYFSSPLYYPNYLTAMMPTVGSMLNSKESVEQQYERYIHLLQIGSSSPYRELLKEVSMPDPFNPGVVETLSADMERLVDETIFDFNTYTQQLDRMPHKGSDK